MTWLFPFYLLGGAAILGPILMHLRRRPPEERVEFSSLMFLDAETPMPVRNRRLENWLLLLLRCLALLLLAFMFARPLWRTDETIAVSQNQATLILLDHSASMRRGDLWKEGVARATQMFSEAKPNDRMALALFDDEMRPVWSFGEDSQSASTRVATIKQRLSDIPFGWAATDLGKALVDGTLLFSSESGMTGLKKRIIVISDMQEGAKLDALRSQVWPETVSVYIQRLEVPDADNLSLSLAAASIEGDRANETSTPSRSRAGARVRIANARDSKVSNYTLKWEQGNEESSSGYLAAGASRVVSAPPALDEKTVRILHLTGDKWDFDNRVFIAPIQPKKVHLVFIGDEATRHEAASPLFYLSRALQPTLTLSPELQVISRTAQTLPPDTDVVFVPGSALTESMTSALQAFMEAGGLVVQVVDSLAAQSSLRQLTGLSGITIQEAKATGDYLMLAEVDTLHPLLHPFADERLRDFTKLRFWKHRRIELDAEASNHLQVIARFDNHDPAILTKASGKGTLICLTSGWHPADSQLALSTKFVPMLYGWLEAAGFYNEPDTALVVGGRFRVESDVTIITPENKTLAVKAGESVRLESVGIYTVQSVPPQLIAVNLPPEESRVTPIAAEKFRELGVRVELGDADAGAVLKAEDRERLATSEQEGRQRAWMWLLATMLAVLGVETWLAGRIREERVATTS